MAEITFTGNKNLRTIQREWCSKFPYLFLAFSDATGKMVHYSKSTESITHADIRGKKGADELSTNASMNVGTFESRYEAAFGCKVEIYYHKNGRSYRSLDENNSKSLKDYNEYAKSLGAVEVAKELKELV
jgi:hypothetical protein